MPQQSVLPPVIVRRCILCLLPDTGAENKGRWMTAAEMFRVMSKRNPVALRGLSAKQFSYRLSGWGLKYKHTNHDNYYFVKHP